MHTYRGTSNDEPQLTEHLAYRWLDPTALPSLDWAEADVDVVKILLNEPVPITANFNNPTIK
jgi:hypothetical protein